MKRFYKTTGTQPATAADGFEVLLDARVLKTAAKRPLVLPSSALANAIAEEWHVQDEDIDPASMPMTAYAYTALDIVADKMEAVRDEVARYAETDLLCYVTDEPQALRARLEPAWQPWLDWSARALDAPLVVTGGVMAVTQPLGSLQAFQRHVQALDLWHLTAMQVLTSVLGSAVLAFAVQRGALGVDEAFALARLEEAFQAEQWGEDEEQGAKLAADLAEVTNAARFLQMSKLIG